MLEGRSQVVPGLGVARAHLDRPLELGDPALEVALRQARPPQIGAKDRAHRIGSDRRGQVAHGLVDATGLEGPAALFEATEQRHRRPRIPPRRALGRRATGRRTNGGRGHVAERGEPGPRRRIHPAGGHAELAQADRFEGGGEAPRDLRLALHAIVPLARVGGEVEELGVGACDVLGGATAEGGESAPAEGGGVAGLGVDLGERGLSPRPQRRCEIAPSGHAVLGLARPGQREERGDRRREVRQAHRALDRPTLRQQVGRFHQPGDLEGRLVEQEPVGQLAVVTEPFAMVRHHDHQRALGEPVLGERAEQAPDLVVDAGDLTVVRPPGVPRREGLGRAVGGVGVEEAKNGRGSGWASQARARSTTTGPGRSGWRPAAWSRSISSS